MFESLKKAVKDYQLIIVLVVGIAFIAYDRKNGGRADVTPNPSPAPADTDTAAKEEYEKRVAAYKQKIAATFKGEFVLDDCAYLAGVFEGIASFIEEDAASTTPRIKSSSEFSLYWTEMGKRMKSGMKGKYEGFENVVKIMIEKIDSDEFKGEEPYDKNHKTKMAQEIRTVSKCLMSQAANN